MYYRPPDDTVAYIQQCSGPFHGFECYALSIVLKGVRRQK